MKKNLLFFCLLLTIITCDAQFQAGQKAIGGQVSLNLYDNNTGSLPTPGQRSTSFSTSLSLSHFKTPTVSKGLGIFYNHLHSRGNIGGTNELTSSANSIGVFVNTSKLQTLTKNFYLAFTGTAQGAYTFSTSKLTVLPAKNETSGYNIGLSGSLGLLYQLNQQFLLTCDLNNLLGVSYGHVNYKSVGVANGYDNHSNTFTFSSGLSGFSLNTLSVGIKYLLK